MNNMELEYRNQLIGDFGEDLAVEYLVKKGFEIICRNYRNRFGEIDIIAFKDDLFHFIEVKTVIRENFSERSTFSSRLRGSTGNSFMNNTNSLSRETQMDVIHETGIASSTYTYNPEDNVHLHKLNKIALMAEIYMGENVLDSDYQIDVVAITIRKSEGKYFKRINFFEAVM